MNKKVLDIESWITDAEVNSLPWVSGRNRFAEKYSQKEVAETLKNYIYMPMETMGSFLENVFETTGSKKYIKGTGVELGAGVAAISSFCSLKKEVDRIYAVELVPSVTRLLQPQVIKEYGDSKKVVPVVGSFDDMKLADESIDFIVEYDSLHHSYNLSHTLHESYRVLKKGGALVAMDRAHHHSSNPAILVRMMNIVYGDKFLETNGYEQGITMTRKDNGEHEIYENEYLRDFYVAGFSEVGHFKFLKPTIRQLAYCVVGTVPYMLRKNSRFKNISTVPLYIIIWPWLFFLLGGKKLGSYRKMNEGHGSSTFKTVFVAIK